jgi:uncharacterized membrane protein (UPF0127 family)
VAIADTDEKRATGLQNLSKLETDQGMLFVFTRKDKLHFWMKDTAIPLDIAFIDDQGKILQVENMKPFDLDAIASVKACRYALEVNRGWFQTHQITVGSFVSLPAATPHAIPHSN